MGVRSVYLDTSAIVKRYVVEEGTDVLDEIYAGAYAGDVTIGFSLFNIGEVAVVFDKYRRRGVIADVNDCFSKFLSEVSTLARLGSLRVVRISKPILVESVRYVFRYGVYIADALQIASAKNFEAFLTFDERLAEVAVKEGLRLFGKE
ncbi:type II toxin-antitoxin system VapC family toxin [Thermofilum pendens]|uniref:PilT protein domain protein n=1 Tax=Thermofilum pendens (strain DSM 2475 / Hrk 5) TaxID=368408 RepID=A1S0V9_THEPD|nr:type II toxin-antitoxin system VapC family toxin [Thermofilum pendens]ABL79089.1 PilT protein domain protein [Thermofilum pendens Hrk 5]